MKKLVDSTDPYKLATQNIVGGTSFKQDLTEKLQSMDYKQLGLSEKEFKNLDPTPGDGKVTSEDANVITSKIMKDEGMLKEMLTDYFTLYKAREHANNVPSELKQNQTQLQNVTNDDLETGSVNDDGIYVPN